MDLPDMSDMRRRGALALLAGMALIAAATSTAPGQQSVPSEPAKTAEPVRFSIAIKNRKVDAAQKRIRAKQGDVLELTFTSDEPAELHLHGYDKLVTVAPNAPAVLRLDAKIAGRFPIEAHKFGTGSQSKGGHVALLYLEVYPR
jgi:FtsP/CotA-like multicopper oxidase with cupredoxin domain